MLGGLRIMFKSRLLLGGNPCGPAKLLTKFRDCRASMS